MKLRHLRVSQRPGQPGATKTSARPPDSDTDALRSIQEELDKCRRAVKSQRYVIARHEAMLRRQRRLVAISLTAALVLAAVTALAVTVQWL